MTAIIADPCVEERIIAERRARGWDRQDEVWNGTYIIMPDSNIEHQEIISSLVEAFRDVVRPPGGGKVLPGFNISDRGDDWTFNFRCPDVGVLLARNPAEIFEAHIRGPGRLLGGDRQPGDKSREKFDFYGELGVRELLLIDRYPWSLEPLSQQRQRAGSGGAGRPPAERSHCQRGPSSELPTCPGRAAARNPHRGSRWDAELGGLRTWVV